MTWFNFRHLLLLLVLLLLLGICLFIIMYLYLYKLYKYFYSIIFRGSWFIIISFKLSLVVCRFFVVDLFLIAYNVKVIHGVSMYVMSLTRKQDLNWCVVLAFKDKNMLKGIFSKLTLFNTHSDNKKKKTKQKKENSCFGLL